jgi:hypothetical protein
MATTRWVRYVVPVTVEIDCDNDAIDRIVALPGEAREDRDDRGQFCIYPAVRPLPARARAGGAVIRPGLRQSRQHG